MTFAVSDPDAPIAVLAAGAGGGALRDEVQRRMPHEDVVLLIDTAYAPYARRQPRVVVDRVRRMAEELAGHGPKLLLLCTAQGTADAGPAVSAASGVPVLGLERLFPSAAVRAPGGVVAVVTGGGCVRGLQQARALRRERGGAVAVPVAWPGLAEAVDREGPASAAARRVVEQGVAAAAGADVLLLACAHAGAVAPLVREAAPGAAVVSGLDVVSERAVRLLRRANALARRKRAGRTHLIATDPGGGQRALPVRRATG